MEAIYSSKTSVLIKAVLRNIPGDDILHSHRREDPKSDIALTGWALSLARYELGFYISEDDILHSHRRENLRYYMALTGWSLYRRRNVSPVKYEPVFISQKTAFFNVRNT
jgi:hypothetical protein